MATSSRKTPTGDFIVQWMVCLFPQNANFRALNHGGEELTETPYSNFHYTNSLVAVLVTIETILYQNKSL